MMIQIKWSRWDDPDLMTIQIKWRSSCDEDPDSMIQIKWSKWDDPDLMMIQQWWASSHDDVDPVIKRKKMTWRLKDKEKLKKKMTWRLEYKEDLKTEEDLKMTRWSSWCREEDQCWKLCRKNTFLVKRECWCICKFRMYSSMYLMYCNPMFIPGCIYYVFDSCCHSLMFRSRGSIM